MKKIALLLLVLLVAVAIFTPQVQAQQYQDPARIPASFYYPATSLKAYAVSQTDTIPQPTSAGVSTGFKLCASNLVSFTMGVNDSAKADVYADYRPHGSATWTAVLTDSIIVTDTTDTSTGVKEFVLRTATVDKFAGLGGDFRIRVAWRALGIAARASKDLTYSVILIWKP